MDSPRELGRRAFIAEKTRNAFDAITGKAALYQAYRDTFTSPQGQIVLRHLIKIGHITSSTFTAGDPNHTALQEGERRIVLSILRAVYRNQDELIRELQEQYG